MSRKRAHGFIETGQSSESQNTLMDTSGVSARSEDNFCELEADEELVCSVSEITEHLGRNITVVLEAALSEIRKIVSVRIRVLKMELREKTDEIELLKARLETVEKDGREPSLLTAAESVFGRKSDFQTGQKYGVDPRKTKAGAPVVKKENINAICDYLMKDKNSRGGAEVESDHQAFNADRVGRHEMPHAPPPPLSLWTDAAIGGGGGGGGDAVTDTAAEDIFSMLPSGSKRLYDYEWMAGVELNTGDFKGEPESKRENVTATREVAEEDEDECEETRGLGQVPGSSPSPFPLDTHGSPGEDRKSSAEDSMDRLDPGQHFSAPTFICPFCGTLCPDSTFLEEHIKLIHRDESIHALQSTPGSSSSSHADGGDISEAGRSADAPGIRGPREKKVDRGYECGDCGRHFNYLGNLRQHQRIHTGEKPFVCPECGERFRHAARLKSHRLSHSGAQSPFPCPQCGKGFPVLSGLKRHQRVHTGESPYACPQCGRRFKELGNLYTHMRIHSGATPYSCYQCGRSFRHLGTYKSHRCTPATQLPSGHSPAWAQEDKVQTG